LSIWRLVTPLALLGACTPLSDLDANGRGAAGSAGLAASGATTSSGASAGGMVGPGEPSGSGATDSHGGTSGETDSAAAGGASPNSGGASSQPGSSGAGSATGSGGVSNEPEGGADSGTFGELTADLPNDQVDSPVQGDVSCFEANYSGLASFEVITPTARYVVLRDHGNIVSITDTLSKQRVQWIGYSDYRPRRVAGILSNGELPDVVTTLDSDSVTARHVRLRSESVAGDWLWVWDFYATQATLTISRASDTFGFTYRGTPGGRLGDAARLVFSSGEGQSAKNSFMEALPGPTPWLYFADPTLGHSLFLIQHTSDELADRYDSLDGDSAALMLGDEKITSLPNRFSLGLVDSTNHLAVTQRAEFVIAAVQ
jgi:hypothetical protein